MPSQSKPTQLPAGSLWFEINPQKEILVYTPYRKMPYRYSCSNRRIFVKKIEKNFSDSESFYFWAAYTIKKESSSATALKSQNIHTLDTFHRNIISADTHFENFETTISHLFRFRHPALDNMSYGMRLFECLEKKRCIPESASILEIGAGLGLQTRDFISCLKSRRKADVRYANIDLSLKMLKMQKERNRALGKRHFFAQADGQKIPFNSQSFNLVIINEVIADFQVTRIIKSSAARHPLIKRYGLNIDDAPKGFLINSGAIEFLEELWRILKPNSSAVIIEYGDEWAYPVATPLKGHTEYSIHFGHLTQVSKKLGFKVECQNLFDFIRFSPTVKVITGNSLALLRRLMRHLGKDLPYFAYTEEMLKRRLGRIYPRIHNLQFESLKRLAVLFSAQEFKVLLLRK